MSSCSEMSIFWQCLQSFRLSLDTSCIIAHLCIPVPPDIEFIAPLSSVLLLLSIQQVSIHAYDKCFLTTVRSFYGFPISCLILCQSMLHIFKCDFLVAPGMRKNCVGRTVVVWLVKELFDFSGELSVGLPNQTTTQPRLSNVQ